MRLVIGLAAWLLLQTTAWAAEAAYSRPSTQVFPRNVYWGDLHVHSNLSPDSYSFGNTRLGPDDAYRFAKGETVDSHVGLAARLRRPLDFLMVADHAEFLGVFRRLEVRDETLLSTSLGKRWAGYLQAGGSSQVMTEFVDFIQNADYEQELSGAIRRDIWHDAAQAAERHNDPGRFTAFIGYEWTSMVEGNNLHRVVVFRDGSEQATQLAPFSALDSPNPEDLWRWMANYEKETGGQVIAIPHNGNLSNGVMFADTRLDGSQMDRAYAEQRNRWEPLYEVTQVKGDGEAHPLLSPDDEFADFETWDEGNIDRSAEKQNWMLAHEYGRPALKLGLKWQQALGANPFKFGLIGSTDSHTALSTADDDNFFGKFVDSEPTPDRTANNMGGRLWANWKLAASGYVGVWAHENTRESLFEAMERKEVYATSGPRIALRMFGGWQFTAADEFAPDIAATGYDRGVPMGSDLPPKNGERPTLLIQALKDPDGANLDRIQIVKGWTTATGEVAEKIYDVALSDGRRMPPDGKAPPVGNTVDQTAASYTNDIGDAQLSAFWADPDFDATVPAFYYVRVLEIPTPRWSAYDQAYFELPPSASIPRVTQERVYSSPVWYTP